jgi:hypothetical protein
MWFIEPGTCRCPTIIYQFATSRSPFIYPLTLRLRKPRSWFHVAAVQQNTDRDYGAHSRLQIQMLYSTVGNGSTVTRLENGLAVHARRHGWWDQGPMRLLELDRKISKL